MTKLCVKFVCVKLLYVIVCMTMCKMVCDEGVSCEVMYVTDGM